MNREALQPRAMISQSHEPAKGILCAVISSDMLFGLFVPGVPVDGVPVDGVVPEVGEMVGVMPGVGFAGVGDGALVAVG